MADRPGDKLGSPTIQDTADDERAWVDLLWCCFFTGARFQVTEDLVGDGPN